MIKIIDEINEISHVHFFIHLFSKRQILTDMGIKWKYLELCKQHLLYLKD